MADKSFGIKELNLISSGTPKIESPNNLNLSAVTVAISTNATVGGTLDVDGHTELDDVNISGVSTFSGITTVTGQTLFTKQLGVSGFSTFFNDVKFTGASYDALWDTSENRLEFKDGASAVFGTGDDLEIKHSGGNTTLKNITGQFRIAGNDLRLQTQNSSEDYLLAVDGGSVSLFHNNNKKIETTSTGSVVTGVLTATSFSGDGSSLTGVGSTADIVTNSLVVSGISTLNTISIPDNTSITLGADDDLELHHIGGSNSYIKNNTGQLEIRSDTTNINSKNNAVTFIKANATGSVVTGILTATNVSASSSITATTFYGSGANLTGLSSGISNVVEDTSPQLGGDLDLNSKKITGTGNISMTGIATATGFRSSTTTGDGSDVAFAIKYYITSSGSSAYRFAGAGVLSSSNNPTLYFQRGFTYILENSTGGSHPFELRVTSGGSAYAPGGQFLTGSTTGTQILTVPMDAPASIVYQCTIHGGMVGTINFVQ